MGGVRVVPLPDILTEVDLLAPPPVLDLQRLRRRTHRFPAALIAIPQRSGYLTNEASRSDVGGLPTRQLLNLVELTDVERDAIMEPQWQGSKGMASELTYSRLTSVFREVFDDDNLTVTPDLTATRIKGWDSLANVRLFLAIEQGFKIRFSAPEMSGLKNVGELAELIERKVSRH